MKSIWSVARQTLSQCLRMKLAVAFIVLLAITLAALPLIMRGDGTLSGGIRTTLNYSLGITGVLLSIITIFATVSVVTEDIRRKHVMMLAVKPLAKWQYMLGRWLGVVLLNAILLAIAAVSTFVVLQYLRNMPPANAADRQIVETEIFAARQELKPEYPDLKTMLQKRVNTLRKEGRFETILDEFKRKTDGDVKAAMIAMQRELSKQIIAELETIGPRKKRVWEFKGLNIADKDFTRNGKVIDLKPAFGMYKIEAPDEFLGKILENGNVQVNKVRGRVTQVEDKSFIVQFSASDMRRPDIYKLDKDSPVTVTALPELQFRYKVKPLSGSASEVNRAILFYAGEPGKGFSSAKPTGVYVYGMGPTKTLTTVTVPAVNMKTGSIFVEYRNIPRPPNSQVQFSAQPAVPVRVSTQDVRVLFRVGDFTANYFRGVLLIFFQMMFLAALAVFCSSFLAFPVASLSCFVLLGSGMIINWLADSLTSSPSAEGLQILNFFTWLMTDSQGGGMVDSMGTFMVHIVRILMPNMSALAPSEKLVDGLYISPQTVSLVFLETVIIRTGIYLSIACLIYHKRELAKVQV